MQDIAFTALVHGVYVVTTRRGDVVNGMTAAWVSQVSLSPLLLMVSIAPARYSHDLIKESGVFAVNVLTADQVDLGKRFGSKSGRQVDKFSGLSFVAAKTGAPILPQAYAYFDLNPGYVGGDPLTFANGSGERKLQPLDAGHLHRRGVGTKGVRRGRRDLPRGVARRPVGSPPRRRDDARAARARHRRDVQIVPPGPAVPRQRPPRRPGLRPLPRVRRGGQLAEHDAAPRGPSPTRSISA